MGGEPVDLATAPQLADRLDPLAETARAASAGDRAATRALLSALAPTLLQAIRAFLGPTHPDADDVVQESLLALLEALPAFRAECSVKHYAVRIAVRKATASRRRSRAVRGWLDIFRQREEPLAPESVSAPDEGISAAHRRLLRELIGELPAPQAEALALQVGLGYSVEEIAAATAVPINTARTRLRLGKAALRQRITADPRLAELSGVGP